MKTVERKNFLSEQKNGRYDAMMKFTLSNGVEMPAVGLGTFKMPPQKAEQADSDAITSG